MFSSISLSHRYLLSINDKFHHRNGHCTQFTSSRKSVSLISSLIEIDVNVKRSTLDLSLSLCLTLYLSTCDDVTKVQSPSLFVKIYTFAHPTPEYHLIALSRVEREIMIHHWREGRRRRRERMGRWHSLLILMITVSSVSRIHGQLLFDYTLQWSSNVFIQNENVHEPKFDVWMRDTEEEKEERREREWERDTRRGKKKEIAPKGSAGASKSHRLYIDRVFIIRLSTNEEYDREKWVFKWVTRVIEDDDDDEHDCSHRCWSTSTTLTTILSWLIRKKERHRQRQRRSKNERQCSIQRETMDDE